MEQADREAAGRFFRALLDQDVEAELATGLVSPAVEIYLPPGAGAQSGLRTGHSGYRSVRSEYLEAFPSGEYEILATEERGDWIRTEVAYRVRSASGVPLDRPWIHLTRWARGKLERWEIHPDGESADRSLAARSDG